jgi:glycosyltransferase involved in cell wall biosynthesis
MVDSLKILVELRPALDGHAGIPQESRLLFRGLRLIPDFSVEGMIQSSGRRLHRGLSTRDSSLRDENKINQKLNRLSRVVVSLESSRKGTFWARLDQDVEDVLMGVTNIARGIIGYSVPLSKFETKHFKDFIWRALFARTLPYADFDTVTNADFRIATTPWTIQHHCALLTQKLGHAVYPRLDTRDFDVMISQTPYPGLVGKPTALVVRYHDAIPILMPHTISDRMFHQASHYNALRCNVANGGFFACVSDATRNDLLSIFPEAEKRAITIHNMVSHHYFREESSPIRIKEIIRSRRLRLTSPTMAGEKNLASEKPLSRSAPVEFQYLLIVSTIEPRKNHLGLLAAWDQLRIEKYHDLKLVTVGMLGWDHEKIVRKFHHALEQRDLFMLEDVPASELRLLYRHAKATICPSFGEGFDYSGVEAMRCGGVVAASDIPVHREIYGRAAEYFSPYSSPEMANVIGKLIDPEKTQRREDLLVAGAEIADKFRPEVILPRWTEFLNGLSRRGAPVTTRELAAPSV